MHLGIGNNSVNYASSTSIQHKQEFASHPCWLLAKAKVFYACEQYTDEFFKALFHGTSLRVALRRMSHAKVTPEELKPEEFEKNMSRRKPPIPYTPKKDVIQEVIASSANMLTLALKSKINVQFVRIQVSIND